jgi:cytochrome c5
MKMKFAIPTIFLSGALFLSLAAFAGTSSKDAPKETGSTATAPAASAAPATQDENFHLEGEKRYRANCGRCHAAPPKFPPRMMATIVRHMRVRATITDQDMHLILRYMTE